MRLFVQCVDFHGWDLHAAWDDFKFGISHIPTSSGSPSLATAAGNSGWFASGKPFTAAKVKYFDQSEVEAAWNWLREEQPIDAADATRTIPWNRPTSPRRGAAFPGIGLNGMLMARLRKICNAVCANTSAS